MSYDQINADGSITRMPGTYYINKARAQFKEINEHNDNLRAKIKKQQQEDLGERSEQVAAWFRQKNDNKSISLEKYLGLKNEN
jgi:hypothetical protein